MDNPPPPSASAAQAPAPAATAAGSAPALVPAVAGLKKTHSTIAVSGSPTKSDSSGAAGGRASPVMLQKFLEHKEDMPVYARVQENSRLVKVFKPFNYNLKSCRCFLRIPE